MHEPGLRSRLFQAVQLQGLLPVSIVQSETHVLLAERLTNEVLLDLPHRQLAFTMPKALRRSFRHDRRLFAKVSPPIYAIITEFCAEGAVRSLSSGMIIAHQTFGDQLGWNPRFHCLVLEGGFD